MRRSKLNLEALLFAECRRHHLNLVRANTDDRDCVLAKFADCIYLWAFIGLAFKCNHNERTIDVDVWNARCDFCQHKIDYGSQATSWGSRGVIRSALLVDPQSPKERAAALWNVRPEGSGELQSFNMAHPECMVCEPWRPGSDDVIFPGLQLPCVLRRLENHSPVTPLLRRMPTDKLGNHPSASVERICQYRLCDRVIPGYLRPVSLYCCDAHRKAEHDSRKRDEKAKQKSR